MSVVCLHARFASTGSHADPRAHACTLSSQVDRTLLARTAAEVEAALGPDGRGFCIVKVLDDDADTQRHIRALLERTQVQGSDKIGSEAIFQDVLEDPAGDPFPDFAQGYRRQITNRGIQALCRGKGWKPTSDRSPEAILGSDLPLAVDELAGRISKRVQFCEPMFTYMSRFVMDSYAFIFNDVPEGGTSDLRLSIGRVASARPTCVHSFPLVFSCLQELSRGRPCTWTSMRHRR